MSQSAIITASPSDYRRLFALSFLSLFVELMLIRWISVEIRIFSYFRNLALISCFLGLGIGFNYRRRDPSLLISSALILVLALLVHPQADVGGVSFRNISDYLVFPEMFIWYMAGEADWAHLILGFFMTAVVMILLAGIFIPLGRAIGSIFERSDNRIRDYSINLAGSLAGTWAFGALSWVSTPPWTWFTLGLVGTAILLLPDTKKFIAGLAMSVPILLLTLSPSPEGVLTYWTPYQKIQAHKVDFKTKSGAEVPLVLVNINSVLFMSVLDLSPEFAARYPTVFKLKDMPYYPYDLPYRFQPEPENVLIVGAGAGNDAAAAIRNRAGHVDAVEIDPVIAWLGREIHPEKPYQDPRVNVVIDDARSFLKKTTRPYDLIVIAGLDSHTLTSNFTNINLDSYVYTYEAFREAKSRLAQGGILAVSFQVSRPWIAAKLLEIIEKVFDESPVIIYNFTSQNVVHGIGGTLFLCGDAKGILARIENDPELKHYVGRRLVSPETVREKSKDSPYDMPTDDWPYLYLSHRTIPTLHLVLFGLTVILMAAAVRLFMRGGKMGPSHFLFLGAAFMLVEVHSITKAALLFGSTWIVNAVIISAILVMILLANLVVMKFQVEKTRWWYAGLFICLGLAYIVPVQDLLIGGYFLRGLIGGAFYSAPLFFAGVIFAVSLKRTLAVEAAFAANLMGAAAGGMLDNLSYLTGLSTVVLIAILLYAASAAALPFLPSARADR